MTATGRSHCFTVSPPKISLAFLLCVLFGGSFLCCLVCVVCLCPRSSSFDRSWVTATCCLPSCFVTEQSSQLSWRVRQWIKKKAAYSKKITFSVAFMVCKFLWRSSNAALVFHMKNDPVWGSLKLTFLSDCFIQRIVPARKLVYALPVRARSFFRFFARFSFRSILHFHVSFVVDCSKKCLAGVAVWRSVLLRPCLSNIFLRWWLPSKSHVFGHEKQ